MSRIQAFYQKLHNQEISLDHLRETHNAFLQEWEEIRDASHPLCSTIEDMFRAIEDKYLALSPLVSATPVSDVVVNEFRVIETWLDTKQLKAIPCGYGARIGVVLHTQDKYIFNISNRGLLSDFGGGVRAKRSPYYGLMKELSEECPQWMSYILKEMDKGCRVHCVESFHRYDEERTRKHTRFSILVFVPMDPALLKNFQQTSEVRMLVKVDKSEIQNVIASSRVNAGLLHMQKYKVYS
jgi:hypothetical protein